MKILSVCGILPIPDLIKENDIVFQIYDHYKEMYPRTEVEFIRTIPYSNSFLSLLKEKWKNYNKAIKMGKYNDRGYNVTVFPHVIFKSNENLFTLLTKITYYQNYFRVQPFADVDIVHAQRIFSEGPLAYKIAKKFSKPLAITIRGEINYFNNSSAEKRATKILDRASFITTPSPNTYSFVKKRYPQKTHLVPHGIDQRFFRKQKKNFSPPVKILTVAKFWEYKNIPKVIKALSKLKKKYDFIYKIVGDGHRRDIIEKCIQKHNMQNHIIMNAHVPHQEMPELYAEADIFVMVSYIETFGRVYFEAMAAGVPIICAKNSGIHGLFEEGKEGFSINHKNTVALKNLLEKLINNETLRKEVGQHGQELVGNYNWPAITKKYHDLYKKAV